MGSNIIAVWAYGFHRAPPGTYYFVAVLYVAFLDVRKNAGYHVRAG